MAKIFLSYSRKDEGFAREFAKRLADAGHDILSDIDTLLPGQNWRDTLSKSLRDADVYIILLSKFSTHSGFVMSELGAARAYVGEIGRPRIIPIVIDDIPLPPALQDIQALLSPDRDMDFILHEISRSISYSVGIEAAKGTKATETARRIDENAPDYIEEAINAQKDAEQKNRSRGRTWYLIGFCSLVLGIIFSVTSLKVRASPSSWTELASLVVINIVVIGFLGSCSRYAYSLGKAYTSEALKASDRIHAISFGKFYLSVFKENVLWDEIKEVFQYWNIDRMSTFSTLDASQIDPQILNLLGQVANSFSGKRRDQDKQK